MIDQQHQRIEAILERLRRFGESYDRNDFLLTDVEEYEEEDYLCQFCHETGLFPASNGGIAHTPECAIALAKRTKTTTGFFDALAIKAIMHQLANVDEWPLKYVCEGQWRPYCPFCEAFMIDGRGTHEIDCAILFARLSERR